MKFYDTNAILKLQNKIFESPFVLSSTTLSELEHIKTSKNKDEEIKYSARKAIHLLDENTDKYKVVVFTTDVDQLMKEYQVFDSPDNEIIACAKYYEKKNNIAIEFVTNDICCKVIAKEIFGLNVSSVGDDIDDEYTGFFEVSATDEELAYLYEHMQENIYSLLTNQYLIVYGKDDNIIDTLRWTGLEHQRVFKKNIKSLYFNKLNAKDVYQLCAIDSLVNNTITAISGKAGSGKSLLSLMVAMYLIESGKYDRLVVLFNPTKARGASDMGYYGGDFIDKAMQNSIGQVLTTKFGDRYAVDLLMTQNRLKLVSMADCRGMEISDNEILWITEGQNTSVDLIKLCLSRVSSGAKVFIEGDYTSQVDSYAFAGDNNGLKRMIDAFKNHDEFGYIQLQNVWRSKIAELCELL